MKTLKWFKNRIGTRIYRDDNDCGCGSCRAVLEEGLLVFDEFHATYLYDTQNDYAAEGVLLNYRDKI